MGGFVFESILNFNYKIRGLPCINVNLSARYYFMGLDSVELIMEVEKHFSISIPDKEAEKAYTIGKLVNCVANILEVTSYDFSLREKTFKLFKEELLTLKKELSDFTINKKVIDSLDIKDKSLTGTIENKLNLTLPGIYFKPEEPKGIWIKVNTWLIDKDEIDFKNITWKRYIDITLAANLEKVILPTAYKSKYEIYLAVMRITVDKIGVEYEEIGIEKSFTDDLGVD